MLLINEYMYAKTINEFKKKSMRSGTDTYQISQRDSDQAIPIAIIVSIYHVDKQLSIYQSMRDRQVNQYLFFYNVFSQSISHNSIKSWMSKTCKSSNQPWTGKSNNHSMAYKTTRLIEKKKTRL